MKINWYMIGFYALAAVLVLLLLKRCGGQGGSFGCGHKNDTISHKIDTSHEVVRLDTNTHPHAEIIDSPSVSDALVYEVIKWKHDTMKVPVPVYLDTYAVPVSQVDTAKILDIYFRRYKYGDTINIPYGRAIVTDTVTQNKIVGRGFHLEQNIPKVRETVVLHWPKKVMLYFGIKAQGSVNSWLSAYGGSLGLKGKNDRMYSVGVLLPIKGPLIYEAEVKFPIRLHK